MKLPWSLLFAPAVCVLACSTKGGGGGKTVTPTPASGPKPAGCLQLVNGQASTDYPAVVRLLSKPDAGHIGVCTGTFISPVAVLTAAHCLDGSASGGLFLVGGTSIAFNDPNVSPFAGGVASTKAFTNGSVGDNADANDPNVSAKDTAIVLFPANSTTSYMAIGAVQPGVGTTVTSVGYGLTTLSDATPDPNFNASKHAGSTKIIPSLDQVNMYVGGVTAAQSAANIGASVIDSFGDSGGPMIFNNALVATLSNGGAAQQSSGPEVWYVTFVDANSANTKALIAKANQGGAQIPAQGTTASVLAATTSSSTAAAAPTAAAPAAACPAK